MTDNQKLQHTILWADDDPDDMMIMREVLQEIDDDHQIVEVDNGRKVLDFLHAVQGQKTFPCLIVLDMNMPVLSGRETLVQIKSDKAFEDIPVVVFTTSNSELDRLFCKRYGAEMITKPPTFTSFKEVVLRLLHFCATSIRA